MFHVLIKLDSAFVPCCNFMDNDAQFVSRRVDHEIFQIGEGGGF